MNKKQGAKRSIFWSIFAKYFIFRFCGIISRQQKLFLVLLKKTFYNFNMNLHENTDFGRKVFFLYPPFDFEKKVMHTLFDLEYEIYIINDHLKAKSLLKQYPDSIFFVNIDEKLTPDEWFNFVVSFEEDSVLSTIFLGILCSRIPKATKEHFLLHATIPAGLISLNHPYEDIIDQLKNILEINGAKGRRKYIRADTRRIPNVGVSLPLANVEVKLKLKDISSVGFACTGPVLIKEKFKINTLLRNIKLTLSGKDYRCSGAVVMSTSNSEDATLVIVFTKGMSFLLKSSIKDFIKQTLQDEINFQIVQGCFDETDYSRKIDKKGKNTKESKADSGEDTESESEETLENSPEQEQNNENS